MGVFANAPEDDQIGFLGPKPTVGAPWNGQSGFDAMGFEVPMFRKAEGERHLKQMGFTDAEKRYDIVALMSEQIARDNTHAAMEQAHKKGLDVTGCYRLLSVLLCHEEKTDG